MYWLKKNILFTAVATLLMFLGADAQTQQLPVQREAVIKLRVHRRGTPDETGAGIYVGKDPTSAYFITAYHVLGPDNSGEGAQSIVAEFHSSPKEVPATILPMFDPVLDLGVISIALVNLPPGTPQLPKGDAMADVQIHIIGHPAASDWSDWHGNVENENAGGDTLHFTTSFDKSLAQGYSGGPVLDSDGRLIGMHIASFQGYGLAIKLTTILDQLSAWRVPANNVILGVKVLPPVDPNEFRRTVAAATDASQSVESRRISIIGLSEFWRQQAYEEQLSQVLAVLLVAGGEANLPIRCEAVKAIGVAIGASGVHGGPDEERSKRISKLLFGSSADWSHGSVTDANAGLRTKFGSSRASECVNELDATREATRRSWRYLRGANLNDTDLRGIQLYSADLKSAGMLRSDVKDANFECANLQQASFQDSNWKSIQKIDSANVRNAKPDEFRVWALARGAKDMDEDSWLAWSAKRPECPK